MRPPPLRRTAADRRATTSDREGGMPPSSRSELVGLRVEPLVGWLGKIAPVAGPSEQITARHVHEGRRRIGIGRNEDPEPELGLAPKQTWAKRKIIIRNRSP